MDMKRKKNLIISAVILIVVCLVWAILEYALAFYPEFAQFRNIDESSLEMRYGFALGLRFMFACYFGVSFGAFIQEFRFMLRNKKPRD